MRIDRVVRDCAKTSAGQEASFQQNDPHPDPLPSGTCLAPRPGAAGARPSGRFTVLRFPALGKIRNVLGLRHAEAA